MHWSEVTWSNVKRNLHSFIVASFNAQSVKSNEMACMRCEISTFIKDNVVDLFFVMEIWLSAQGDEAKTVKFAPSGFAVKSFPHQLWSRGGRIATVCKSTLGSNIKFKTNFVSYSHVVRSSAGFNYFTAQHIIFFCLYRPPPNRQDDLTDSSLLNSCLTYSITQTTSRICISCWRHEYPLWQSTTITNQTDFDYS